MNTMQMENGIMNTTQENKELLIKYLSMAMPYDLKLQYQGKDYDYFGIDRGRIFVNIARPGEWLSHTNIYKVKPYLRPMSSMTEEEEKEYNILCNYNNSEQNAVVLLDWLLKKRFDLMGLIPKGLAIDITKENNPYKQYIVITQNILDYIEKNSHNFENPMPTLGEKWIVEGEFIYSGVCGGQPVIEIRKTTGEFMRLPKSIVKVE